MAAVLKKGDQAPTAAGQEALADEGDTAERGSVGTHGKVCVQGKSRGMGMQHDHIATEEKNLEELPFNNSLT